MKKFFSLFLVVLFFVFSGVSFADLWVGERIIQANEIFTWGDDIDDSRFIASFYTADGYPEWICFQDGDIGGLTNANFHPVENCTSPECIAGIMASKFNYSYAAPDHNIGYLWVQKGTTLFAQKYDREYYGAISVLDIYPADDYKKTKALLRVWYQDNGTGDFSDARYYDPGSSGQIIPTPLPPSFFMLGAGLMSMMAFKPLKKRFKK